MLDIAGCVQSSKYLNTLFLNKAQEKKHFYLFFKI